MLCEVCETGIYAYVGTRYKEIGAISALLSIREDKFHICR